MIRHVSIKDFFVLSIRIFLMQGVSPKLIPCIVRLLHSLKFPFQMCASVVAPLGGNGNKDTSLKIFLLLCLLIKMYNLICFYLETYLMSCMCD